jgi:hypothetical protein
VHHFVVLKHEKDFCVWCWFFEGGGGLGMGYKISKEIIILTFFFSIMPFS